MADKKGGQLLHKGEGAFHFDSLKKNLEAAAIFERGKQLVKETCPRSRARMRREGGWNQKTVTIRQPQYFFTYQFFPAKPTKESIAETLL